MSGLEERPTENLRKKKSSKIPIPWTPSTHRNSTQMTRKSANITAVCRLFLWTSGHSQHAEITADELEIDTVDSERLRRKKQKKERKARQADEAAALVHNAVPKGAIAAAITPPHVTACAVGDVRRGKATEAECIESERSDSPTVSHRKQKKSKAPKPALINPDPGSATVQEASPSAVEAFLAEHSINIISDTPITPIISFGQLAIPPDLSASLQNFKSPTAIQACTWPPALQGRDVVGIAETGRFVVIPLTNVIEPDLTKVAKR
jgi:hypothetical protein